VQPRSQPDSLLRSLRRLTATIIAIVETRLALLATDLEEGRGQLASLLVWSVVAVFFFALGTTLAALFVVIAFWDTHRLLASGLLSALFLGASALVALALRHRLKRKPKLFAATLGELAKDRGFLADPDER
jgi:uncharacterized membrane protein YqjE